jgi:hypothetical protein
MVAWANHSNGTDKQRNLIGNLQTGPSQTPSSGRHSNISNPVRERGRCHTYAVQGGGKAGAHREPTLSVAPGVLLTQTNPPKSNGSAVWT